MTSDEKLERVIDLIFPPRLGIMRQSTPLVVRYDRSDEIIRAYLADILQYMGKVAIRKEDIDFRNGFIPSILPFATYMYSTLALSGSTQQEWPALFSNAITQFCKKTQQRIQSAMSSGHLSSDDRYWPLIKAHLAQLTNPTSLSCLFNAAQVVYDKAREQSVVASTEFIWDTPAVNESALAEFDKMKSQEIDKLINSLTAFRDFFADRFKYFKSSYEQSIWGTSIARVLEILTDFQNVEESKLNLLKSSFHLIVSLLESILTKADFKDKNWGQLYTDVARHEYTYKALDFIDEINSSFLADELNAGAPYQKAIEIISAASSTMHFPSTTFFTSYKDKKDRKTREIYQEGPLGTELTQYKSSVLSKFLRFWTALEVLLNLGVTAFVCYMNAAEVQAQSKPLPPPSVALEC